MGSGFFEMCGSLSIAEKGGRSATAPIDLSAFSGWKEAPPQFLLVEALNQFCCRLAREVILRADGRAGRVLPAKINALTLHAELPPGRNLVTGSAVRLGPAVRVNLQVRPEHDSGRTLLSGELVAMANSSGPAGIDARAACVPFARYWAPNADPLFKLVSCPGGEWTVPFVVRADCALLAEHFPDYPIAPGSLTLAWVWEQISRIAPTAPGLLRLSEIRFAGPVVPGPRYNLLLRPLPPPGQGHAFAVLDGGRVCTSGEMRFVQPF